MSSAVAANGAGKSEVIEIQTESVGALFDSFDPAPMSRRRISVHADDYVVQRVVEMREDAVISLDILLPPSETACCADVQEAFRAHYTATAARQRGRLKRHFKDARLMLLYGIILAVVLITLARSIAKVSDSLLLTKIAGGLSLMVWVALWRPVDMLLYEWRPIMREVRIRDRLAGLNVRCTTSG